MNPALIVIRLLLVAIFILPSSIEAKKQKPFEWDAVSDSDWEIIRDTAKNYTDAVMIFERIIENDKKLHDDKCYRTIYRRIRILSDNGRDWADVEVPFLEEDQKIEDIQGRTVLRDGTVTLLGPEHIFEKQAIKTKKKQLKQTTFVVPGVTDDCVVEYMIKIRTSSYNAVWVMQKDIPLLNAELRWILAKRNKNNYFALLFGSFTTPNYLWINTYSKVDVEQLPNIKKPETLLFVNKDIPAFEEEPFTVPEASLKTKLFCYYGSKEHAEGYWDKLSRGQKSLLDMYCMKNDKVVKIVEQFSDKTSDEEKILAAGDWIRENVLNLNYFEHPKIKAQKKKKKKKKLKTRKSVNDVIKLGYGTRLEINYLFCDMLREMNIDAKMVFAKSRFEDLFVKQAKYWQFDRALVAVEKRDEKIKYYSPGFPYIPVDETPYSLEGVIALVSDGKEYLTPIPFSEAVKTTISRIFSFTIDEDLEIKGSVSERSSGAVAQSLRFSILDEDTVDIKNLLEVELEGEFDGVEIELLSYEHFNDLSRPVVLKYEIKQPEITETGSKVMLRPLQYLSRSKSPFDTDERKEAIMFEYGYRLRETAQFTIPEDWQIEAMPSDTVFKNQIGQCAVSYESIGNTLTVQRMFLLDFPFWHVEFIDDIRDLFRARQNFSESIVVLAEADE